MYLADEEIKTCNCGRINFFPNEASVTITFVSRKQVLRVIFSLIWKYIRGPYDIIGPILRLEAITRATIIKKNGLEVYSKGDQS
uniref:Uncharacterized protein n=1 Tax=viral metagenome TaxID=1070528 RepID=A0A6M3K327_9ZZZZ